MTKVVAPLGALKLNLPSLSVCEPFVVPFATTLTPGKPPFPSEILPEMMRSCAVAKVTEKRIATAVSSVCNVFFIQKSFV